MGRKEKLATGSLLTKPIEIQKAPDGMNYDYHRGDRLEEKYVFWDAEGKRVVEESIEVGKKKYLEGRTM